MEQLEIPFFKNTQLTKSCQHKKPWLHNTLHRNSVNMKLNILITLT